MSREDLKAMLDELVAGEDGPELLPAWQELLRTPGAADLWEEAAARRRRTDELAGALLAHPWLARAWGQLRRLRRSLVQPPGVGLEASLRPDILAAVLGPTSRPPTHMAAPKWGQIEPVALALRSIVEIRPSSAQSEDLQIFYRSVAGEGRLRSRRWRLEPGEAPVLLLGVTGAGDSQGIEEALMRAVRACGILLIEAAETGQ